MRGWCYGKARKVSCRDSRASGETGSRSSRRVRSQWAASERDPEKGERIFCTGGARPPTEAMTRFIDDYRREYGVESICRVVREALRLPTTSRKHAKLILRAYRLEGSETRFSGKKSSASGMRTRRCMVRARCGCGRGERATLARDAPSPASCV